MLHGAAPVLLRNCVRALSLPVSTSASSAWSVAIAQNATAVEEAAAYRRSPQAVTSGDFL